jgi:hypothetical protein
MTYGYEIQYECDDGYILVGGDAIRSCSDSMVSKKHPFHVFFKLIGRLINGNVYIM